MSSSKWFIVLNSRVEQGLGLQVWELQKPFSSQPMSSEPLWKLQGLLFPSSHGWKETPSLCLSLAPCRTGAPCEYCGWSFSHLPDGESQCPSWGGSVKSLSTKYSFPLVAVCWCVWVPQRDAGRWRSAPVSVVLPKGKAWQRVTFEWQNGAGFTLGVDYVQLV